MKLAMNLVCISCLMFCFAKCQKERLDSNGLPVVTQSGKNTYGFLLDGEPWVPDKSGPTAPLMVDYDPNYAGGSFNIRAYRSTSTTAPVKRQTFTMWGSYISSPTRILLPDPLKFGFSYTDGNFDKCSFSTFDPSTTIVGGYLDIKKLDLQNGIFAGEFELTFKTDSCQEINITKGRFDLKL